MQGMGNRVMTLELKLLTPENFIGESCTQPVSGGRQEGNSSFPNARNETAQTWFQKVCHTIRGYGL